MGEPRFGLLETVREFAAEQLETCGEAEAVHARHFDWCLAFAEARQAELRGRFNRLPVHASTSKPTTCARPSTGLSRG